MSQASYILWQTTDLDRFIALQDDGEEEIGNGEYEEQDVGVEVNNAKYPYRHVVLIPGSRQCVEYFISVHQ